MPGKWHQVESAEEFKAHQQREWDEMDEVLHLRMSSRGAPGPKFRRGTPRRAEPSCRPYSVAEFAAIVEKANTTGSPPQAERPEATIAIHPNRQFLHVRRTRPEPIPWGSAPSQAEEVCAYDQGPGRRSWSPIPPTSGPPRLVFQPPRPASEKASPSVAPYLVSIDTTLKELDAELTQSRLMTPYIDQVTRILERLEQREARAACAVPAAPTPSPPAEHTTRSVPRHSVPVPPVRERNTLHRYFRSSNSPPSREASYGKASNTPGVTAEHKTAQPLRQDTPPTGDSPPRRWFHTAAGKWIDLAQLDPVDWSVASTNLANSVAHLQPAFREGHMTRADVMTA